MKQGNDTSAAGSNDGGGDENRLIAERRAKLTELRARGVAFPNDFRRAARGVVRVQPDAGEGRRPHDVQARHG
ncbi:MAG: hypothetical protein PVS2B3_02410 [Steroidobacteraceae bacterium]